MSEGKMITRERRANALRAIEDLEHNTGLLPLMKGHHQRFDSLFVALRDAVGLADGEYWKCESCDDVLVEGDKALQEEGGEFTYCETCAPTYSDQLELVKSDPAMFEHPDEARTFFQGKVDAGEGDAKQVHAL